MTPLSKVKSRKGFALILSLAMMGFLLLLFLAMMALMSVELQMAGYTMKRARAEQNALLALNIALGELQKTTGPDQRVTSRADLQYASTTTNGHWTGVYGHALTPQYDLNPKEITTEWTDSSIVDSKGSAAKLLSWLVSGNSTETSWPEFNDTGELTDPSFVPNLNFLPDASVGNLAKDTPSSSTKVTIQDSSNNSQPARILVGQGSVTNVEDFVVAPLVTLDSTFDGQTDSYAYWVADENVKARANLEIETDAANLPNAFANATRTAIELMIRAPKMGDVGDTDASALDAPRIDLDYDPFGAVTRADNLDDLALLSSSQDDFFDTQKLRFHDISFNSTSLLTDSFAGGLKRDLSTLLSSSYSPPTNDPTADSNRLWTLHPDDTTGYAVPTWGLLRSFAQSRVPASRKMAIRLPAYDKPGYENDVGISPVLTYFSLGLGFSRKGNTIEMNMYPLVVLWNPYNFTLMPPADSYQGANMEVGMMVTFDVKFQVDVLIENQPYGATGITPYWKKQGTFDLLRDVENISGNSDDTQTEFIRFGVEIPATGIPPGQSLAFVIPESDKGENYSSYAVLENSDPVFAGYASLPVATLDQAYSDTTYFRVGPLYGLNYLGGESTNWSQSLLRFKRAGKEFGGSTGGTYVYLGKPRENRLAADYTGDSGSDVMNPANINIAWYQTVQGLTRSGTQVALIPEEPLLVENYKNGQDYLFAANSSDQISLLQRPKPLQSAPDISYVLQMHALFSGAGSNGEMNVSQYQYQTRWIAQGNMRATRNAYTRRDRDILPQYVSTGGTYPDVDLVKYSPPSGSASARTSAGSSHDAGDNDVPVDASLFEFLPEDQPLLSIGQLQHANLSLVSAYPSYPIGNSLADFHLHEKSTSGSILSPEDYQLVRTDSVVPTNNLRFLGLDMQAYYDISYLLNRNLWDQYFVSSIPETGPIPALLPNPRMQHDGSSDLRDPDLAAAHTELLGGFNINSTSEQAWRAVLGGVKGLAYKPGENGGQSASTNLPTSFPRFTRPTADSSWVEPWQGYRSLTEDQVAQLAHNIVTEIKNRGPFVSLGDFVNRRLVDNPDTHTTAKTKKTPSDTEVTNIEYEDLSGALQAALDRTWNQDETLTTGPDFPVNDPTDTPADPNDDFWVNDNTSKHVTYDPYFGSGKSYAYDRRRMIGGDAERKPVSNNSTFSPKFVTQADILSTIGASLTARSDTFTIRAYGEVSSDFNKDEAVGAWCEVVVQRVVDYVDANSDNPEDVPSSFANQTFGRQYKLISFRWLSADEV